MGNHTPKSCRQCTLFSISGNFCSKLTPEELNDLNAVSRFTKMKRGDTFNDDSLHLWPIVAVSSGVVSLQHLLEDGRKTIAALFMCGDIIDLRRGSHKNRGNLIALKTAEVCRLSPAMFEDIVAQNPDAQKIAWSNLREQMNRSIDHSVDLAKKQALEKLASFVFECKHRQSPQFDKKQTVTIPVRRIDLAEYIGMQPETVSRCFKELEENGIIELKSLSSLVIKNLPALRRIANGDRSLTGSVRRADADIKILNFG